MIEFREPDIELYKEWLVNPKHHTELAHDIVSGCRIYGKPDNERALKERVFSLARGRLDPAAMRGHDFAKNNAKIESWFNLVAPQHKSISDLKGQLALLCAKPMEDFVV
jgi:hypothetical protein